MFCSKSTLSGNNDEIPVLEKKQNVFSNLNYINTSPLEIAKIIRNIKKSYFSHCGIPGKLLSIIATPVSFGLCKLFNNLFSAGHFPDIWKIAHVSCVWKRSGLKSDKSAYRPISLLPTLSKVCESVMHNRLLSHFIDNNVISERQAAYLKGDSTVNQLLYIVHFIRTSWAKGNVTQSLFLDVSAAFDKVWHRGLLAKLEQVSVEGQCLELFRSYLQNRKQVVVVDSSKSNIRDVSAGVPQGSRLGPLLFILYINDIIDDLESEVMIFADDTSLLATGKDPFETSAQINRDLVKISAWADKWKVKFNASKSKDMIFSNKYLFNSPPLIFDDTVVKRVVEHKHLGLWLSSTLDWKKHVHETCLKANRKLYVLRTVKFLNRSTLDLLYKIQIRSVIDYMLPVFYHTLRPNEANRLIQIQYKAAKLVSGSLHFTNRLKLEEELGWESLSTRADFLGLSLFHKIHLHETRPLVRNCMPSIAPGNGPRTKGNYTLFPNHGDKYSNSFFPYFTKLWNNLPQKIKGQYDLLEFKNELKIKLKPKKYKHFFRGGKLGNSFLCQLRVGRTYLNSHSYAIGHAESPTCLCHHPNETTSHFVLSCFLYQEERRLLFESVEQIAPSLKFKNQPNYKKLDILLHGYDIDNDEMFHTNIKLQLAMQNFLLKTKRLNHTK